MVQIRAFKPISRNIEIFSYELKIYIPIIEKRLQNQHKNIINITNRIQGKSTRIVK